MNARTVVKALFLFAMAVIPTVVLSRVRALRRMLRGVEGGSTVDFGCSKDAADR